MKVKVMICGNSNNILETVYIIADEDKSETALASRIMAVLEDNLDDSEKAVLRLRGSYAG